MRRIAPLALLGLAVTGVSALSQGCVIRARPAVVYVESEPPAPPPPQVEVIGVAPQPGFLWIGGHWWWNGNRYIWRGGHWSRPGGHGHWIVAHWDHRGNRWYWVDGHWD